MKKILGFLIMVAPIFSASSQSKLTNATFNKIPQTAIQLNLAYSEEAVSNAIANKLGSYGKPKKMKEFLVYRNVNIPEISSSPVTLYFNVEKRSRNDNNNAVLILLLSNEFERFYNNETDPVLFKRAIEYLNGFSQPIASAELELVILAQDETTQKVDKKLKKLRDETINLQNQEKKLQEKIEQNKKDIESEEAALAKQKELLDGLIKQRKN
ncbi:MAG: hypothetical protein WD135_00100 [Ferruginibacter sp.]